MEDKIDKKKIVEGIRKQIEASKDTHIWCDYINALKLISQVVFTKSSGFILELIQNAEDAGLGLVTSGVFEIKINKERVKITHNGKPFDEVDVKALCGIRSSKKPERGTLGYLGIGFKSVFKITDCPEIYSNGYQFKFDRNDWHDPINTPWHVIPILVDKRLEIDDELTTFIIPYRENTYYSELLEEVRKLKTELYLFLRWLKKITITDEESGQTWCLENLGENEEGITILNQDNEKQRFKFFHRTIKVPDWVKQDRLTQEYRANVTRREIAIAFTLDWTGNLEPKEAGAMYGGVYSFLPLGEASSGAKFPIQADFLVQPGRDAINCEAKWNHWLVDEVTNLCKEAIEYFKKHDKWKYQFLPALEFTKSIGSESYDKLFGPKLIEPLEKFLCGEYCIPTIDGGWAKLGDTIKVTEDQKSITDLTSMGIIKLEELPSVMGGKPGLKIADSKVKEGGSYKIKRVDRIDLLKNKTFLEGKVREPNAVSWFQALYLWLYKNPIWSIYKGSNTYRVNHEDYKMNWLLKDGRTYRAYQERYHDYELVLTADSKLAKGGEVALIQLSLPDQTIKDLGISLQGKGIKSVLHPDVLASVKDPNERESLKNFLTGFTGIQIKDIKTICQEALLLRILTSSPRPSVEELLKYTIHCQQILGEDVGHNIEFWVLTKQGEIRSAREALLPKEFKFTQDWETHAAYVPGLSFVSEKYIEGVSSDEQLRGWCKFFEAGGVKEFPDNGVEEFALNYAQAKLKAEYKQVKRVDKMNYGYDLEITSLDGEIWHFEVKGQTSEKDVELTENETKAADKHRGDFFVCIVSSIPENPIMYEVRNPIYLGKKDKLTIPIDVWKKAGRKYV